MKFNYNIDKNIISFEMNEKETVQLFKQTKKSLKAFVKAIELYDEKDNKITVTTKE